MALLKRLGTLLEQFYKFCGFLAALCLVALALSVLLSITSRFFQIYIGGLTEIAGYLMAAANCLGLAYTFRNGGHISINLFTSRLSAKKQKVAAIWGLFATSAIMIYLAYYMIILTYWSYEFEEVSEGSDGMLLYIPQTIVAFGCVVMALSVVHTLLEKLFIAQSQDDEMKTDDLKEATNE
ncbi:TRAP transporter small permease [Photobacterium minamisatsumaniensis]|uniref:TRAP transporter small permease n=1 Tax=Photobacterium minamisatsumaniensis TaxID=2910233 RepID=UPI003D0AF366